MISFVDRAQWNPGLTIWQGDVKIISLNRDIVMPGFPVQRYFKKISKNVVIPG